MLGEVNGHKVILGTFSSVFKTQFFGSMKETNKDIVNVEETTFDAFKKMIDYIYSMDIDFGSMSIVELYDIVNLAEMYDVCSVQAEE